MAWQQLHGWKSATALRNSPTVRWCVPTVRTVRATMLLVLGSQLPRQGDKTRARQLAELRHHPIPLCVGIYRDH